AALARLDHRLTAGRRRLAAGGIPAAGRGRPLPRAAAPPAGRLPGHGRSRRELRGGLGHGEDHAPPARLAVAVTVAGGPIWGAASDDLNATILLWPPGGGPEEHV